MNDFTIYPSVANTSVKIGLVNSGGYLDYEVKWTSGKDGRRYQVNHVFQYAEVRNGTDTTFKAISLNTGTLVTGGLDGGEAMATTIDGEDFFQTIGSIIQPDASVEQADLLRSGPGVVGGQRRVPHLPATWPIPSAALSRTVRTSPT
ncbi:MAG: hypothetical protein V9F04_05335 [Dermatophilaceae bacterium]